VLLGAGQRFLPDGSAPGQARFGRVRWEKINVREVGQRTSMVFRAVR
jgi:hypothetical protein